MSFEKPEATHLSEVPPIVTGGADLTGLQRAPRGERINTGIHFIRKYSWKVCLV